MNIKASAPGKRDLRDHCDNLQLRPGGDDEMAFLSALYRTIAIRGGTVTIAPTGEEPLVTEFCGMIRTASEGGEVNER